VEEEFEASKESITGRYDFFSERKRKKQVPSGLLTVLVPEAIKALVGKYRYRIDEQLESLANDDSVIH